MNPRLKFLAGSALALSMAAGTGVLSRDTAADSTTPKLAGVAAGMHFTDEHGNARVPTAAERAALAAAFQADIANLAKGKGVPAGQKLQRNGSYRAVVGTEKLQFLTVEVDEQGKAAFGHSSVDKSGPIDPAPANDWPEM